MATQTAAVRAQLFMRQCRINSSRVGIRIAKRGVSSSHLAPSSFSKPLRFREDHENEDNVDENNKNSTSSSKYRDSPFSQRNTRIPDPSSPLLRRTQSDPLQSQSKRPAITTTGRPIPGGFINFIKYRILNFTPPKPIVTPPPFNVLTNPYRARKQWPPDFRSLHPKQQFHFEKTYRRRLIVKAKSQRYNWNRYIRLLQQSLIVLSLVYFVFIADPYVKEGGGTPLDGFRAWFFGQFAKNEHISEGLREHAQELQEYYSRNWNRKDEERNEVVMKAMDSNMASSQAVTEKRGSKLA